MKFAACVRVRNGYKGACVEEVAGGGTGEQGQEEEGGEGLNAGVRIQKLRGQAARKEWRDLRIGGVDARRFIPFGTERRVPASQRL